MNNIITVVKSRQGKGFCLFNSENATYYGSRKETAEEVQPSADRENKRINECNAWHIRTYGE